MSSTYARVVELADSLDSGSSVHDGRAGSSPASRTKKERHLLSADVFLFLSGGRMYCLEEIREDLGSGVVALNPQPGLGLRPQEGLADILVVPFHIQKGAAEEGTPGGTDTKGTVEYFTAQFGGTQKITNFFSGEFREKLVEKRKKLHDLRFFSQ